MKNLSRNTVAVLVVTLFTGLAVFSAIQLGGHLFGTSSAGAQTVTTQAAVEQPAESSGDGYEYDQVLGGESSTDPYGQSSGGTTMTCPATGCSASTCHASQ